MGSDAIVVRRERALERTVDDEKPAVHAVLELAVELGGAAIELAADVGAKRKEDVGRPVEQPLAHFEEFAVLRLDHPQRDGTTHRK
jgi:hypothetical protein